VFHKKSQNDRLHVRLQVHITYHSSILILQYLTGITITQYWNL